MSKQNIDRTNEISKTKEGYNIKIVEYNNFSNIIVEFDNGCRVNTTYQHFKEGQVKNPYHPSVQNVGYLGIGKYNSKINGKITLQYKYWRGMLQRCYDDKCFKNNKNITYEKCVVCEEWHNFQNFAKWFDDNYYEVENEIISLDKDILFKGNKIYSPTMCIFTPQRINTLFLKSDVIRGDCPIGVSYHKKTNKFVAQMKIINECDKQIKKHLGLFNTPKEAFECYKAEKEKYIKEVADQYKDKIPKKLYDALYRYKVEVTD